MGNVAAAVHVSNESAQALIRAYGEAFQCLIYVLMLVTVGSGVVVGWLLDEPSEGKGNHLGALAATLKMAGKSTILCAKPFLRWKSRRPPARTKTF
jgi:hypothetical protein